MMSRVVVGMSGGVDSSVAAALLKEQGYAVIGVTMKIWAGEASCGEERGHGCYGPGKERDIEDARRVAQSLDIPFHVFDLSREYKTEVLDYFCQEYLSGKTPNPCVRCNHRIKFDALLEKTRASGIEFDYFATGHYLRSEYDQIRKRYLLKRARDLTKDQSYFLFSLTQQQLARSLFPLGGYTKREVRKMAADRHLTVHEKPESQDFVIGGYSSLLDSTPRGSIIDRGGKVLGEHRGIPFYTIGQRKGLGIAAGHPLYVIGIDPQRNTIIVGEEEDLYNDELVASGVNWIALERLQTKMKVKAKIRYRHPEAEAVIAPLENGQVRVKFKEPQMSITPGQAVVFYDGDIVVGGGTIESTAKASSFYVTGEKEQIVLEETTP
ncbi:MAG: tRNA 2-thiouridine(34) synthase MnmA [Dehalococcoidia bacterium]|nr:tRNA 2-thiouridine(34) synthase MnmA [Dehalococcoidia bacterium]